MSESSVSVIVAAHNEQRRIGECLASLVAQSDPPLEILVADDGSTDATAAIAGAVAGVRVLRGPRRGKARTINAAAAEARGDILLFLDADMVFDPDYIARLVQPIRTGAARGTAHGRELVANPGNRWAACWQRRAGLPPDQRIVLNAAALREGSIVFRAVRRDEFLRVGGFDDIGYRDDQTLAPKLGYRAQWVPGATCRHYNPETLREVVALGRWGAQSLLHERGAAARRPFGLARGLFRAAREGWRYRSLTMAVYAAAYEWGLRRGLAAGPAS